MRSWDRQRLSHAVRCIPSLEQTVSGAALVVEAIVERPDAKRSLYAQLEALMAPDAILASNTSNLDIFPLVPPSLQKRTIIAHWYTPPYLCDLVDLCPGPQTDPAAIATVRDMVRAMGKVPVVFKQMVQGYVANRLQAAMGLEVQRMLDEGLVTPKDIDNSVIHGMALRMPILGIMAKADFTGLPLMQQGMANRSYTPPEVSRPQRDARQADRGRPHRRDGRAGYFDWGDRSPEELFRERDRKLLALKRALREIKTDGGNMISYDLDRQDRAGDRRRVGHRLRHGAHAGEIRRDCCGQFSGGRSARAGGGGQADRRRRQGNHGAGQRRRSGGAERMVHQAVDDLGRLDLLVNNAGTPGTRQAHHAART